MKNFLICCIALLLAASCFSQKKKKPVPVADNADSLLFSKLEYRLIGPWRGGRSAAVAGSYTEKNTFYFGATGGGVWKTTDGGSNWKNISDKYFGGSIGSIAVAPSDENIIYAGEGENTVRGNVSEGLDGMWKSDDGGRTWKNIGLKEARHIIRILVHPRNPDIVWVAVIGHLFGPDKQRGLFKTTDGGKTWKQVLYVNDQAGASDLVMEPGNPEVLYAGTWRIKRTPYSLESGGEGSGLWKSTDEGETWKNISSNKGLPDSTWGIVGIAVPASNPSRVYALIENAKGGLFVSDDEGETWTMTSNDNNIRQRAWYFNKIFVDPSDENLVYVLNVGFMRSTDGGKTWKSERTPHGDHHDLWIDPKNGKRMIVADDGGAQVSFDGGENWSTYMNQPTAQIYRVSTDNAFPYRLLGAQQDNSTLRIRSRTYGGSITGKDWEPTAGFESGYVVADPLNPDIVYGGNYGGYLSRLDHKTGENRAISVWPDNPTGYGAGKLKYRFQWNFPIFFSPNNPHRLYTAANVLFVTENEGQSWQQISPDLTTDDKSKQGPSGGPITKDNTSVEYYSTIFTATESPYEKDLLWTGSDDGLIYVSRDAGKHWENVTPKGCPQWMMWNCVDADPFKKGAAYFAGTRYKMDDFTPYIYKTEDYGKTWKLITNGIDKMHFTRVVRADKKRPGLLYAGTEYGMYISYDDGANWRKFQLNLPMVSITDLTIKDNDLAVATQGRAFYILDELNIVQQYDKTIAGKDLFVFKPEHAWRMDGFANPRPVNEGKNPPNGAVIDYYAAEVKDSVKGKIVIMDSAHTVIKTFATDSKDNKISVNRGMNRFVWDMEYPSAERIEGMILWNGYPGRIKAPPGKYFARVVINGDSSEVPFDITADPNYKITQADYNAQFAFLMKVKKKFEEVQETIKGIRSLRDQLNEFIGRQRKDSISALKKASDSVQKRLTQIEEQLYQTKAKSGQDVLNYPIRLNDKLSGVFDVANSGNFAPSKQVQEVYSELSAEADKEIGEYRSILANDLPDINRLIHEMKLPVIMVKSRE